MVLIWLIPNVTFNLFLLHPNRLNVSKIINQNVRDHVYYTRAESMSFYPVAYVAYLFIKDGCGCGCLCVGV